MSGRPSSFCKCNTCTFVYIHLYIVYYSTSTKVELQIWDNDKVKCHVFYP